MIDAVAGRQAAIPKASPARPSNSPFKRPRRAAGHRRKSRGNDQGDGALKPTARGAAECFKKEINDLQVNLEAVRTESLTDPLTQLANRKYFDAALEKAIADASREERAAFTDADRRRSFQGFNDNFGHLTGDQVLRLVAMSVKNNVKGKDTAARYGGEEFAVILPNTISARGDHRRRPHPPRSDVKRTDETFNRGAPRTCDDLDRSCGSTQGRYAQSLIERADDCLYAAKRNGRNRVMCEADPEVVAVNPSEVA